MTEQRLEDTSHARTDLEPSPLHCLLRELRPGGRTGRACAHSGSSRPTRRTRLRIQYQKLRDDPTLIPNMVTEIIRWQTPLAHMRRTATRDTTLAGKRIMKGDKISMWYVSANRDDALFGAPNQFRVDREDARHQLSFGIGIHFCMGSRLAEMQLRVLWEEVLKRFHTVELVGKPLRVRSCFVKGSTQVPCSRPPVVLTESGGQQTCRSHPDIRTYLLPTFLRPDAQPAGVRWRNTCRATVGRETRSSDIRASCWTSSDAGVDSRIPSC